ncbi:MAG TPA: PLP-dependent aminotransferase family protein [Caulobacteraceae bacterium]|nr:PLP-dependent aminotransferase family protein [Caulobacteraceae bacterium]
MQAQAQWRPRLDGDGSLSDQIVAALAADIDSGRLAPDVKLPTHRRLAEILGVGIGTVTRAYMEAEGRGLVTATVGRGTFVASAAGARGDGDGVIDLARNLPPAGLAEAHLAEALARVRRRGDLGAHLDYAPPAGGFDAHRRAGARWLAETANFADIDWRRLIVTAGAQQAIAIALLAAARPGTPLIVEAATFSGIKTLAASFGYELIGAALDAEGLTPEALDSAAARGARVAYVQPLQNPTGRLMGLERRRAIVEVARRRDLMLIEDDLYAPYASELERPPLALLAPERTFYVAGLSKSLAPGLRVGYCAPPVGGDWQERCTGALRALAFGPPSFGALVATQWIEDGSAQTILDGHRRELARRTAAALDLLGDRVARPPNASATHLWAPMSEIAAERAAARALRERVEVTPPSAPIVAASAGHGLRLCLGGPSSMAAMQKALAIVVSVLSETADPTLEVV